MGLLKTAILGAAVYAGFKYVTKKDPVTGKSIVDGIKDQVPEWKEKARNFQQEVEDRVSYAREDLGI